MNKLSEALGDLVREKYTLTKPSKAFWGFGQRQLHSEQALQIFFLMVWSEKTTV